MKFINALAFCAFYLSFNISATPVVGTIVKVKGKVTLLGAQKKDAVKLKVGDTVGAKSSILTGPYSFVKIKILESDSFLSLGGNSKIYFNDIGHSAGMIIDLLKGNFRAHFKEGHINKYFYIRTMNASLKTHKAEFYTIYSPKSRITTLMVFSGDVKMVKSRKNEILEELRKVEIRGQGDGRPEIGYTELDIKYKIYEIEKQMGSTHVAHVLQGQFSSTSEFLKKVLIPVKLNPVQLNILYQNINMIRDKIVKRKEVIIPSLKKYENDGLPISSMSQTAPLKGHYDRTKKTFAPRAGGVLDLKTGVYVVPDDSSEFEPKSKTYIPKGIGFIHKKTGQYIPPKGLKLSYENSYIPRSKFSSDVELISYGSKLSEFLVENILKRKEENKEIVKKEAAPKTYAQIFKKDTFSAAYYVFDETLEVIGDSTIGNRSLKTKEAYAIDLLWKYRGGDDLQLFSGVSFKKVSYNNDDLGSIEQEAPNLFKLEMGVRWNIFSRLNIVMKFNLEQEHFVDHVLESDSLVVKINQFTLPKIMLGFEWDIIRSRKFSLLSDFIFIRNLSRERGTTEIEQGNGFYISLRTKYWFTEKYWADLGYFLKAENGSLKGTNFVSDYERDNSGYGLRLGVTF